MSSTPARSGFTSSASSVLWGLFCACSWTWCIGMYLPVIMIQRFGWPGFLVFAVPNVLGCAAFGYVIRNRQRSEAMIEQHGAAMTWFSIITVAYHMFFAAFLLSVLIELPPGALLVPLAAAGILLGLGIVLSWLPNRDWLVLTVLVYAVSLAAFWAVGFDGLRLIEWAGRDELTDLAWLAPIVAFGFLLCPYLDLTFHRAIQHSPSRHAFAVFGLSFAVMLVLTCAIWFWPGYAGRWLPAIALAHILGQSTFTIGAHVREIRLSRAIRDRSRRVLAVVAPLAAAALPYLGWLVSDSHRLGEDLYLRFLVFYGLVFPAYVLLFCGRSPVLRLNRAELWLFVLAVAACLLPYERAFIGGQTWWLAVPIGLLTVLWLGLRGKRSAGSASESGTD